MFNNEGNTRDASVGDIINHQADQRVTVTFKQESHLSALHTSGSGIIIEQVNPYRAYVTVPAAGFVVMTF